MKRGKRPTMKADEHPRPQVMVPMDVFGGPFFRDYARLGRWVHMWTFAVWKKDPTYRPFAEDNTPETIDAALMFGWLVKHESGHRLTGPSKDPKWLLDAKKTWTTYAIEAVDQGLIKVGKTTRIERRLDELQCASPFPLRLLGAINGDHERRLHRELRPHHASGEWFALNGETAALLESEGLIGREVSW